MDSSSSPPQWEYDVFLSFRGEDTRNAFTAHLCDALWRRGINTFIDDPKLKKGQLISPALLTAIQNSMFCIIVLSQNYASSSWCLEELVKILESKASTPERVLPIFYNVDPFEVRKQKGEFGKSFERLVESLTDPETKNRVKTWREALKQVAQISGWDSRNRHEPSLIKEIIATISNKLFSRFSADEQNLAGIDYRIEEVMSRLCINNSSKVITIGICGMGGVGKTTLAYVVYRQISHQFECSAFLENVGEDFQKQGLNSLAQKLLSQEVDDGNIIMKGCTSLEGKLCRTKALIVLDNVRDGAVIEYLTANNDLFGAGSRIIITAREKDLFTSFLVKYYEVETLDQHEAMQVLRQYFSKHDIPADDLWELCDRIIRYAQGLPLALKILGPLLFGKEKPEWRSQLNKLESTPHPTIQRVLQISYDGLDHKEKNIFLDIACFFKDEDKDHVIEILEACGFFPHCGIRTLLDKSLISIFHNKLKMHDLIQAMAMEVVRQNSPNEPGRWSRLWSPEDVFHVLDKKTGTEEVEGIFLDSSKLPEISFTTTAFARMKRLKLLKFHTSGISEYSWNFTFPSGDLRYLYWHGYSSKSFPGDFNPKNLVELNMPHSHIHQLWKGEKALEKLKFLDLNHSQFLKKIPDLSRAINLERLVLEGCTRLSVVDPSLSDLKSLVFLSLRDCINLRKLPSSLALESLQTLILSGCSNLAQFPETRCLMKHLKELSLDGTAIEELPTSIGQHATGLLVLDLRNCKSLKRLPNEVCNMESLETLLLSDCSKLESLPNDFGKLKGLRKLHADRTALRGLPGSFVDLRFILEEVSFSGCKGSPTSTSWILPWKKSYSPPPLFLQLSACHSLLRVNLSDCNLVDGMQLHSLCLLSSLRYLNLSGNNFAQLPSSFAQLSRLHSLELQNCKSLQALPELPSSITEIVAYNCISLGKISNLPHQQEYTESTNCLELGDYPSVTNYIFQKVASAFKFQSRSLLSEFIMISIEQQSLHVLGVIIPGSGIPEWFSHQNEGDAVSVKSSPNVNPSSFLSFAYCLVLNPSEAEIHHGLVINCSIDFYSLDRVSRSNEVALIFNATSMKSDHIWLGFLHLPPHKEWDSLDISFTTMAWDSEITITRCGVRLMYNEDMIEQSSAPQPSRVVIQELDSSMAEDIEAKRTNGSGLELENADDYNGTGCSSGDLQSEMTIDGGDSDGSSGNQDEEDDIISLDQGEASVNQPIDNESCACNGSKAQERKNSERRPHLRWDATFALGLIFSLVVAGSFWMRGRTCKKKNASRERASGVKENK